jgi:deoxyribonuclease V
VYEKRKVGYAIKTKKKPIYVSPGNMISLESSLEVVLHCIKGHRLPEPIRLAHNLAKSKV